MAMICGNPKKGKQAFSNEYLSRIKIKKGINQDCSTVAKNKHSQYDFGACPCKRHTS